MELIVTSQFYFIFNRVGVSQEQNFISNQMGEGER
jgi:hypothetical protein